MSFSLMAPSMAVMAACVPSVRLGHEQVQPSGQVHDPLLMGGQSYGPFPGLVKIAYRLVC